MQRYTFPTLALALILCGLFWISPVLAGTVYTWTDADGVKRYSNSPPPEDIESAEQFKEYDYDRSKDDQNREEYDRMVDDASYEADKHFRRQARQKAREDADRQQAQEDKRSEQKSAERARLERKIEALKQRGLGPNFTQGMRDNLIQQIQDQIDRLESAPEY